MEPGRRYVRPFGASVLIGSYTEDGPQLHAVDPSGVSYRYFATAIGKGKNGAKSQLEKLDLTTLTAREAVVEAAKASTLATPALAAPTIATANCH